MNALQIITETLMRIEGDPDRKLFEGYAETILADLERNGVTVFDSRVARTSEDGSHIGRVYDGEHLWPVRDGKCRTG